MVAEDVINKIIEYLKKHGQTNTFKLATELKIDRHRILNIIKKLEEKQAIEVRSGVAKFLKFSREEKITKKLKVKKAPFKPKKELKYKKTVLEIIQAENKRLKEKLLKLQNAPPRIIRRTKVEKIIQKVPVKSEKLKEQTERIKELEGEIEELKQKARAPPKVIRKIVVKKVPVKVKEYITKTIIKKVPVKVKKEKIKPRKFKFPKINFSGLGKNIKKLHVPEMLKK